MLPPLPRSTEPQFLMNTAHSETGGTKYLLGTSSFCVSSLEAIILLKKTKPGFAKTEKRISTSKTSGFRWFLKAFFERTKKHNEENAISVVCQVKSSLEKWRFLPKHQVPGLQVLASLVERGEPSWKKWVQKTGRKYGFWTGGPYTHIRSMYGIFSYLWLIFMVNVSSIHVSKYSIHGSYGLHRLHPTWIIYLADSGALNSPSLLENDTSGLFAGCFSCRSSLWSSLLVDFISSTNLVKEGDYGEKNLKTLGFGVCTWFSTLFLKHKVIFYSQNKLNLLLGCESAHSAWFSWDIQVGGFNPFDSIRFKMGIFPKQTETTTKHVFKSKKYIQIYSGGDCGPL